MDGNRTNTNSGRKARTLEYLSEIELHDSQIRKIIDLSEDHSFIHDEWKDGFELYFSLCKAIETDDEEQIISDLEMLLSYVSGIRIKMSKIYGLCNDALSASNFIRNHLEELEQSY